MGHVSLWIGKHFNPAKIKGVDIDVDLVKAAKKNIVHYIDENYVTDLERSFNNQEPPDDGEGTGSKESKKREDKCDGETTKDSVKRNEKEDGEEDEEEARCSKRVKLDADVDTAVEVDETCTKQVPPPRPPPPTLLARSSTSSLASSCDKTTSNTSAADKSIQIDEQTIVPTDEKVLQTINPTDEKVLQTIQNSSVLDNAASIADGAPSSGPDEESKPVVNEQECEKTAGQGTGQQSDNNECDKTKLMERVERTRGTATAELFPYNVSFVLVSALILRYY